MQTFNNIANGETGLSVRGKLNNALTSIISGSEGINAIWAKINSVISMVNAMEGGIGGLVKDTSYDPASLDPYKSAVLIALCTGTFNNIKDKNGTPITIPGSNAFTIFYRAANTTYWEYDSQTISPTLDGKISSDQTKMVDANKGYITNNGDPFAPMSLFSQIKNDNNVNESLLDILIELGKGYKGIVLHHTLDSLGNPGVYLVKTTPSDASITYILEVLIDPFQHQVSQVLLGNVDNPNESYLAHHDSLHPRRWCRYAPFTLSSGNGIPGDWSKWELVDFFDLKDTNASELDIADDYGNILARFSGGHIKTRNFDSGNIKFDIEVEDNDNSDLDVSDPDGNVIAQFKNGHIQTQKFNSEVDGQTSVVNGEDADLDIADEQGNAIACFSGGEFQTKNFNTANTPAQADDNGTAEFQISDPDGNVIAEFQGGHFRTKEFDSRNVSGAEVVKDEQGRNILLLSKGVAINKKLYL